jgi:hypothetical protein
VKEAQQAVPPPDVIVSSLAELGEQLQKAGNGGQGR